MANIEPQRTPIEFKAHPPERRRLGSGAVCCCGCSCCCCCCLHTLGSLIGATLVAARAPKLPKNSDFAVAKPEITTHLGTSTYWKSLGGLLVLSAIVLSHGISELLLVLLLGMPLIQLSASLIAAIVLAFSRSPRKSAGLKQIWSITVWTFLGGLIGIGIMVGGIGLLK